MMTIENDYNLGEIVYLKTDQRQLPRIVCALEITPKDILYMVSCGENTTKHYAFEMAKEKQYVENR